MTENTHFNLDIDNCFKRWALLKLQANPDFTLYLYKEDAWTGVVFGHIDTPPLKEDENCKYTLSFSQLVSAEECTSCAVEKHEGWVLSQQDGAFLFFCIGCVMLN